VANFGFRTVTGTIPLRAGGVLVDGSGAVTRVHAVLDLDGLATGSWRRDADLRKPHLLDIDRHPELTFDATSMVPAATGWLVDGRLSARGTSVSLPLAVAASPVKDETELHATAVLDRRSLGVRAPRLLIGHVVTINLVTRWRRS
jgi:polyisoprenoid-binding protein YceI